MQLTQSKTIRYYRIGVRWASLLTLIIFIGHYFLPAKTLEVKAPLFVAKLYGFVDREKGTSAYWVNEEENHWICHYKSTHAYGCGWSTSPDLEPVGSGVDLTSYDFMEIKLQYTGPASRIRAYLRNFNPAYSDPNDLSTTQPMETTFATAEANQPVLLKLSDFALAHWWLMERKHRRHWSEPEKNNITSIGLDFVEQGKHEVIVERITLIGKWIYTETLILIILSLWMTLFLIEGGIRFYGLYRAGQRDRTAIQALLERQRALEEQNKHLEALADTDPLTGVYNRAGLRSRVDSEKIRFGTLSGLGVLVLDLDHFKNLNDRYGHDMGDKVLKAFTSLLAMNLRTEDIFARMGGEEFMVVCRRQPLEGLRTFAEKLRSLATQCTFNGDDDLHISVSIGVAVVGEDEDFADAVRRADQALLRAKQNGRDRVEFTAPL